MAVSTETLVTFTRGLAVDQVEAGITNIWTDSEVINSINQAKHDLYGRRPDAFSVSAMIVEEPADIAALGSLVIAKWAEFSLCLKASSVLMDQKSKDSYYRKASEQNAEKYLRSI